MASYATTTDLAQYAVNPSAFASVSAQNQQAQLDAASTVAEGYLADQYHLPIVAPYPVDLKIAVCSIAAFYLMSFRGFQPDGKDIVIRQRYEDAISWLKSIATGTITPAGIIDSTPQTREGAPAIVTGVMGNVVGGYAAPTTIAGNPANPAGVKPYPYTGTVPGRRGW
jgi:phage gp36-like protein